MKRITNTALTIAGFDPSGGAGLQADLKTFAALGVNGKSVATSITIQNTLGVEGVHDISPEIVEQQLKVILEDIKPDAIKIGMLGNELIVKTVVRLLRSSRIKKLIVDPVISSSSGKPLLSIKGIRAIKEKLLPITFLLTPNLNEAEILSGIKIKNTSDRVRAARVLVKMGAKHILIKGGHLKGKPQDLFFDGKRTILLDAARVIGSDVHGTGCVLASAITAGLVKGKDVFTSVKEAKELIGVAIMGCVTTGKGVPQVEPLIKLYQDSERYTMCQRVLETIGVLKDHCIGELIPEVQSNIGFGLENASNLDDIIGFPGRIIRCGKNILIPSPPRFGGSRHVADIVLTVMQFDPSKRAVMNIKYNNDLIKVCKSLKFSMASFDRAMEPKKIRLLEGSSLEWGTAFSIRKCGFVPDIIFDKGGMRKEEMIRVIAEDIESLADKVLKIHRRYLKILP
jgi:hydroxymethylpyrimidine kinase / phosphomethylpyrimidine kinase / thiamine-phosphate diphosphorylase